MTLDLNSKYNQSVPAFKSGSNVVIEVLPWLVNQPWNDLALAYVTALRPSCIRFRRFMPAPATKPTYQRVLPPRKLNAVAEAVYEYTRLD